MAQGASEYVRGFSFMPENKVDVIDLQYIEGGELSRAWKISRRERLKNIEAKIWDEFLKEQDIVDSIRSDDPYQFLDEPPGDCIKEVLDKEIAKKKEDADAVHLTTDNPPEQLHKQEYKEDPQEPRETMVTFAEALQDDDCDVIAIVDEEDGSDADEREEINESIDSPCTVRENQSSPEPSSQPSQGPENAKEREKSPENVTNMIEASIYTAKVKELQSKVNLELLGVITTLEAYNVHQLDPNLLPKLQRQCSEFCARFSRIYLYPISRQVHDVTRHNNSATPYARHTHTRSQLVRTVSLQQNMIQSLQMFHKWFTQKMPLRECVFALKNFIQLVREADSVCPVEVHNEELLQTCEGLEKALGLYMVRLNSFLGDETDTNASVSRSAKSSKLSKKKSFGTFSKQSKSKRDADSKLSMYSLDVFPRFSKASIGRTSCGTSKARLGDLSNANAKNPSPLENANTAAKKSSRSRRPLMRAPGGRPRRELPESDNIATLVETVNIVVTPHMSVANSVRCEPPLRARSPRTPASHRSPRSLHKTPRSPRGIRKSKDITHKSPRRSPRREKELEKELKLALEAHTSDDSLPSVIKVQCAKKDSPVPKTSESTAGSDQKSDAAKEIKDDKTANFTSDVSVLLRQLCEGNSNSKLRNPKERASSGSKNTQLLCINGGSPRSPSLGTPQLLRILEETIQKQAPKPQFSTKPPVKDLDRYRLNFNRSTAATEALFQYRTKFVQHMLSSPLYANSKVGKPWEMIGKISEEIIDEILLASAKEMQLGHIVEELYKSETQ